MNEVSNQIVRSRLWSQIYDIIKEIPRAEAKGDALDATSATTLIEALFYKWNQSTLIEETPIVKDEKEICVSCGTETEYYKWTPVDHRYHYVDGAGQLCEECYNKIFKK